MTDFAFVTTCKGRLHHLQQTLPLMVAEAPDQIVVVDYGCPQRCGDWVEAHYPQVSVLRINDDPGFHLARARNAGAHVCHAFWLCFIDADIRIRPGFVDWMRHHAQAGHYYRQAPIDGERNPEACGTVLCPRPAFKAMGGYDEVITGWGGEDKDLYERLQHMGLHPRDYPAHWIHPITHEDSARVAFHTMKDHRLQQIINGFYRKAKLQVMRFHDIRGELPVATRRNLLSAVQAAVQDWGCNPANPPPSILLNLDQCVWMPPGYQLKTECRLSLSMDMMLGT